MRVLITGHTGFKGSWLSLLLTEMGHEVHGFSLEEEAESLFKQARVKEILKSSTYGDIRSRDVLQNTVRHIGPEVVIHMAAQAFVLKGYRRPLETFETNVMGTLNVLKAAQDNESRTVLVVTTDKVYRIGSESYKYQESDPLGGSDPYSASKVAADIAAQSLARLSEGPVISIARAGNVVGGGDYGTDRIIPDLVRATVTGKKAAIRKPTAIRPWQHVLDCLYGYWKIIENSLENGQPDVWNVGPSDGERITVEQICQRFQERLQRENLIEIFEGDLPQETNFLQLDSGKILRRLGWENRLGTEESLSWTFDWYKGYLGGDSARVLTMDQIRKYLELVKN